MSTGRSAKLISFLCEIGVFLFIIFQKQFFVFNQYQIRIYLYAGVGAYLLIASRLTHINRKSLGITKTNLLLSMRHSVLPTLVFSITVIIVFSLWPSLLQFTTHYASPMQTIHRFFTYFLISVPMQELIFRGYVTARLEQLTQNKYLILFISSLIFAVAHIPFGSTLLVLATFFLGLILEENFLRFRNLYTPMLIHLLTGTLYMYYLIR